MLTRIHSFAGLLTLVNLLLYGVVGITALFADRGVAAPVVWERPFAVQTGESDRAVAERVVRLLGLTLATPVHDFAIRRDGAGRLVLDFYHANGRHKVTVSGGWLHVEQTRAGLAKYLTRLHVTTAAFHSGDWRMQWWAWWNEFAMWCVAVMAVTGVWIWWGRRGAGGKVRRTHRYTAMGTLALIAVYEVSAVQMAHRAWMPATVLNQIHRMRGVSFSPLLGMGIVVLCATGVLLWWQLRMDRRVGLGLLGCGCTLATGLIWWMRMG